MKTCCPPPLPSFKRFFFFLIFNLQNVVRAFLSDPVSIPCFFRNHYPLQSSEVKFILEGGGGEKCFTVFAFLEKQDRKLCFLNCGLLYRLLGHKQHTSWGEDFSHSEDPWKLQERRYHVRLDKTAKAATNLYVFISTTPTPAESFIRRGGEKGWHQRRTEEDAPQPERTVLCLLDTHMPAKTSTIQT